VVTLAQYLAILDDRPRKFNAKQVDYGPAPQGSVMRCAACFHYFRRAVDGFTTCEIFRDDQTDAGGVRPDYRCGFWTVDGDVHPFVEEETEPEPELKEDDIPF
jgi:hypothetical protein